MTFLNKPDQFPSNLKNDTGMEKLIATSKHFQKLSLCFEEVMPKLIVKDCSFHSVMSNLRSLTDSKSLLAFFSKYFENIHCNINSLPSCSSQIYKKLAEYLEYSFEKDLTLAMHSDVKNLVISLKRGGFKELQKLSSGLLNK